MHLTRAKFVTHTLYYFVSVTQWVVRVDALLSVCSCLLPSSLWFCYGWWWRGQWRSRNVWNSSGVSANTLPNMSGCGLWVTCQWERGGMLQTPTRGEDLPPTWSMQRSLTILTHSTHSQYLLTGVTLLKHHGCQLKKFCLTNTSAPYSISGQKSQLEVEIWWFKLSMLKCVTLMCCHVQTHVSGVCGGRGVCVRNHVVEDSANASE